MALAAFEHGPDGLINIPSPGMPKLEAEHRAFLSQAAEEGPIPAVHVMRWRACNLIAMLQEEFGLSVSANTITAELLRREARHIADRYGPSRCRCRERASKIDVDLILHNALAYRQWTA